MLLVDGFQLETKASAVPATSIKWSQIVFIPHGQATGLNPIVRLPPVGGWHQGQWSGSPPSYAKAPPSARDHSDHRYRQAPYSSQASSSRQGTTNPNTDIWADFEATGVEPVSPWSEFVPNPGNYQPPRPWAGPPWRSQNQSWSQSSWSSQSWYR